MGLFLWLSSSFCNLYFYSFNYTCLFLDPQCLDVSQAFCIVPPVIEWSLIWNKNRITFNTVIHALIGNGLVLINDVHFYMYVSMCVYIHIYDIYDSSFYFQTFLPRGTRNFQKDIMGCRDAEESSWIVAMKDMKTTVMACHTLNTFQWLDIHGIEPNYFQWFGHNTTRECNGGSGLPAYSQLV